MSRMKASAAKASTLAGPRKLTSDSIGTQSVTGKTVKGSGPKLSVAPKLTLVKSASKPVSQVMPGKAPKTKASGKAPAEKVAAAPMQLIQGPRPVKTLAAKAAEAAALAAKTKPKKKVPASKATTREEFDALHTSEVWVEYAATKRTDIRNYFWERYLPLVRYISERTYSRLPDEVDINDLIQAGQFGLMDAINAFDLSKGVKFETYSAQRIKGAILDELRSMDWVPRLVRSRTGMVHETRQKFEMKNGRSPTLTEISALLGIEGEELEKVLKDSGAVSTISLNRTRYTSDGNKDVAEIDVLKDQSQKNPLLETQRRDIKDMMTKGLSRAERLIVTLYYYEEMTMKEIGQTLDLSESRVSQMHSSILQRLKSALQNRTEELEPEREDL